MSTLKANIIDSTSATTEFKDTITANGDKQWVDSYGVIKTNRDTIAENVTIPHLVDDYYALSEIMDGTVSDEDKVTYGQRPLPLKIESLIYLLCGIHFPKLLKQHQAGIEKYKKANVYANDIDVGNLRFQ